MKIIHCADLHLDSKMQTHLTAEQASERRTELLVTFRKMVSYASEHQIEKIIIAGDMFDDNEVSRDALTLVRDTILGNPEIDFFYLRGNHDSDVTLLEEGNVPKNLKLFSDHWMRYIFPDRTKSGLAEVDIVGRELKEEDYKGNGCKFPVLKEDSINILILHGQLTEYASESRDYALPLEKIRHKNVDYLALGHVHEYKCGELDERGLWCNPGCLEGRGFDECGNHGFVVLDIDRRERTVRTEFVPFAGRTIYQIEVDISGSSSTIEVLSRISDVLKEKAISYDSLLSIVLYGSLPIEAEINQLLIRRELESGFYCLRIKDQSTIDFSAESYELDRSLKGEFVRQVLMRADLDDEMKAEVIRCGIASLKGER